MNSQQSGTKTSQASTAVPSKTKGPKTFDEAWVANDVRLSFVNSMIDKATEIDSAADIRKWGDLKTQKIYEIFPRFDPDSFEYRYPETDDATVNDADDATFNADAK